MEEYRSCFVVLLSWDSCEANKLARIIYKLPCLILLVGVVSAQAQTKRRGDDPTVPMKVSGTVVSDSI